MCWPSGPRSPAADGVTPVSGKHPAQFEREMGCLAEDFRGWLPGASRFAPIRWMQSDAAEVGLPGAGSLRLSWSTLPNRRLGLVSLPRLLVTFDFGSASSQQRDDYMRYFDLYTQRGGG